MVRSGMGRFLVSLAGVLAIVASCARETDAPAGDLPSLSTGSPKASATHPAPVEAGKRLTITSGELVGGTHPRDFSRDPALEPQPFRVKLGAFEIDALPYPNDPARPTVLSASPEQASQTCSTAGGRLCTELEWERACRGPDNHLFPGGNEAESACFGVECSSAFGVRGLGARPEWTSSSFATGSPQQGHPVLKGPPGSGETAPPPASRHCSRRSTAGQAPFEAAFRCCYGAPNAARAPEPKDYPVFETPNLEPAKLRSLLKTDPRTEALAKDLVLFSDPEATNTVLSRGPGDRKGFSFSTGPLLWSPTFGSRFLVVAAKSGKSTSFVLVYHALEDGQYSLASSFILDEEQGPVAFAFSPSIRPRLHFTTCWGCPGETGKVLFRKPDKAVILQP